MSRCLFQLMFVLFFIIYVTIISNIIKIKKIAIDCFYRIPVLYTVLQRQTAQKKLIMTFFFERGKLYKYVTVLLKINFEGFGCGYVVENILM